MKRLPNFRIFGALVVTFFVALTVLHSQPSLQVGYAVIDGEAGTPLPASTALFSFRNQAGILVSEASVSAVSPIRDGRIFVDQRGTRTGLALANPSDAAVVFDLILRDNQGLEIGSSEFDLGPKTQSAFYVDDLFNNIPAEFIGTLTFTSRSQRGAGAVTLRQSLNSHQEPLLATLPVADLDSSAVAGFEAPAIVFPHLGAGSILSTQIILIETGGVPTSGTVSLTDSNGNPLSLQMNGQSVSTFPYSLQANGTFVAELTSSSGIFQGYAVVTTEAGAPPAGTAVFQFRTVQGLMSEAGVGSIPSTAKARIFVDNSGTQTGVALASPGNAGVVVTFDLLDRNGGFIERQMRTIPANGHLAIFADELFRDLPDNFIGILEISSPAPIVPITLKFTVNGRGEFILTTLPVADLDLPPLEGQLILPQIGLGPIPGLGDFATRIIFVQSSTQEAAQGALSFINSDGSAMLIPLAGEMGNSFSYRAEPGGARLFFPGVDAPLAAIVIDQSSLVVNDGQTTSLRPILLDTAGNSRDDFPLQFSSLAENVAQIDELGRVQGLSRGFSTVTIASGGILEAVTVTVTTVTQGASGFEVTGIAQNFQQEVFLGNSQDHTILKAATVATTPTLYAGRVNLAGLVNSTRLNSRFDTPGFLALSQAGGDLFVSDTENHVIRRVLPGTDGTVSTLAGTGSAGSLDGPLAAARFNRPQGLAFDDRGRLWVADSANHTIRLISFESASVQTVAGSPGNPGLQDGSAAGARFNTPMGLAVEFPDLADQLGFSGEVQPVSVVVADSGNGLLRRVYEDGRVETVSADRALPNHLPGSAPAAAAQGNSSEPLRFNTPTGVVSDSFGNIYVSEPSTGKVRIVLRTGEVIQAAQSGTFESPQALAVTLRGRVVVAESSRSAQEFRYAAPSITSVEPSRFSQAGGDMVTLRGRNIPPDTLVIIGGVAIRNAQVVDTSTIVFTTPQLPSGRQTLTLQSRGGLNQTPVIVEGIPQSSLSAGEVTTLAGGTPFGGDGLFAANASLQAPRGIAFDTAGNLYVADTRHHRIRKIDAVTLIATTFAGNGVSGYSGDGGLATTARLNHPTDIAFDPFGNLHIADTGNHVVRKVNGTSGTIQTFAGTGIAGSGGDGGPAQNARLASPVSIAFRGADLLIADRDNHRIRRVRGSDGTMFTLVGTGTPGYSGDGGPPVSATLSSPSGVNVDQDNNLYIADSGNHAIRFVGLNSGTIVTVAGTGIAGFSGDGGMATSAQLYSPDDIVVDSDGNLFISDTGNHRIRRVSSTRTISTEAGNGLAGFSGDGGPAVVASLNEPRGLAINAAENLFVADMSNWRIRQVTRNTGVISTFAGNGMLPDPRDGGPATEASFGFPASILLGQDAQLIVSDAASQRVRLISGLPATQPSAEGISTQPQGADPTVISTLAGNGLQGFLGDDGPAGAAQLDSPWGLAFSSSGDLLLSDSGNHRIRRVELTTPASLSSFLGLGNTTIAGAITTVVGNGTAGFGGDGGPALSAALNSPLGSALDSQGRLVFADSKNHRVRRFDPISGTIATIAGTGTAGFSGDGASALFAWLNSPTDVAIDAQGNVYVADSANHRIRRISPQGQISTVAGNGSVGFSGDGGSATQASLNRPSAVFAEPDGTLWIADSENHRVRVVANGIIETVAGNGIAGYAGDGGSALSAAFNSIQGLALDSGGNLYIADSQNRRIRFIQGPIR